MNKISHVLDPIQNKLDQKIFRGTTLRSSVSKFVEEIIFNSLEKNFGFKVKQYLDIYLSGSLTTYQYHDTSDFDTNIFIKYDKWPDKKDPQEIRKDVLSVLMSKVDGKLIPDTQHPIQIFVFPEGIEPRDRYDVGLRSAWSFTKRNWFIKPEKDRVINVVSDASDMYAKAVRISEQMEILLEEDPPAAKKLYQKLRKKRAEDQDMYGDFSEGNIVYKMLDKAGLLDKLTKIDQKVANILKEAEWKDIEQKAKRYIEEARYRDVTLTESPDGGRILTATVIGQEDLDKKRIPQTGIYETEIHLLNKQKPNELSIWYCTCPWGQVSWGRSGDKKKYEGRPCTHALVLYWISQTKPYRFREEVEQLVQQVDQGQMTEDQARQTLEDEATRDFGPFQIDDVVRIKPYQTINAKDPTSGENILLNQGLQGTITEYDSATNKAYVLFDDDQGTYLNFSDIGPIEIDGNALSVVPNQTRLTHIYIKSLPEIYEIT